MVQNPEIIKILFIPKNDNNRGDVNWPFYPEVRGNMAMVEIDYGVKWPPCGFLLLTQDVLQVHIFLNSYSKEWTL